MSIFIEGRTPLPNRAAALNVKWGKPPSRVCAVVVQVPDERRDHLFFAAFFRDQNDEAVYFSPAREHKITAIEWQVMSPILVIADVRGCITCIHAQDQACQTVYTNSGIHNAAITTIECNKVGHRLISGDQHGHVIIWKVDPRGMMSALQQYRKRDAISCAVFASPTPTRLDLLAFSPTTATVCLFFATTSGRVTYADDLGHDADVQQLSSSVDALCFYEERNRLIVITRNVIMTVLQLADDGRVSVLAKVKLSVGADTAHYGIKSTTWAGVGLLAASTAETMIRFWDLYNDANYNLSLSQLLPLFAHPPDSAQVRADKVISVKFSPSARLLAAGTMGGIVGVWRFIGTSQPHRTGPSTQAEDWEPVYATVMHHDNDVIPVTALHWGTTSSDVPDSGTMLSIQTPRGIRTVFEVKMQKAMATHLAVLQTAANDLSVIPRDTDPIETRAAIPICGLAASDQAFVVWSGKQAQVFQVEDNRPVPLPPFDCTCPNIAIREDSLFITKQNAIDVCNFQGKTRATIAISESHGLPKNIDILNTFLAVVTDANWLTVYDIRKSTHASIIAGPTRLMPTTYATIGIVTAVRVNADGRKVAILTDIEHGSLHIRTKTAQLFVYDCDKDTILSYDFQAVHRCPTTVCWDSLEPKLLVVEGQRQPSGVDQTVRLHKVPTSVLTIPNKMSMTTAEASMDEFEMFIMFVASNHGILMHDSFPRKKPFGPLLGIQVPRIYFTSHGAEGDHHTTSSVTIVRSKYESKEQEGADMHGGRSDGRRHASQVLSKIMRDFVGIDLADNETKQTLLDFSFYVAIGNLDAAYKSVRLIKNATIWENMAHMCVKTKRLDIAEVCLGNMGHARGAAAVREAKQEPELEAQVAAVAIQLGLLDEAARLYRECGRYDLLNELYRSAGLWERAIAVAETRDRIHLRTTHHLYAQHLEDIGDIKRAIEHYTIAGTHITQVPRMLFSLGRMDQLSDFVHRSEEPQLWKWWAGYLESQQRYDQAEQYYSRAADHLSLIRLACFQRNSARAAEIVESSGDRAAAYYLARQCESQGDIQDALTFYGLSGCCSHGIRLAKANRMYAELMGFALKANPSQMLDVAEFYEANGQLEKAVQLYQRAGQPALALKVCNSQPTGNSNAADDIIQGLLKNLAEDASEEEIRQCAEVCEKFGRPAEAVKLYARCNDFERAIAISMESRLSMTRELADLLTPPRDLFDGAKRKQLLGQLAVALQSVGAFELASAKYTQAGEKVEAMKCLIKAGKTESIIRYASLSKLSKTYEMAANYLQSLRWTEDANLYKTIVVFYTKAGAFEHLASFYDYCAQMEIDDYQNYKSATMTLKKAHTAIENMPDTPQRAKLSRSIGLKVSICEQFSHIQDLYEHNPQQAIDLCREMLADPNVEVAIRLGDCYSMMVNHYYDTNELTQAYTIVQQMQEHGVTLRPYLETNVIADIYRAVGKAPPQEIEEPEIDDEIEDEVDVIPEEKLDSPTDRRRTPNRYSSGGDYKYHK